MLEFSANSYINRVDASRALARSKGAILQKWELTCRNRLPAAEQQTKLALLDSFPRFLDQLTIALWTSDSERQSTEISKMGSSHGAERSSLEVYSLGQVIQEYHFLREVLVKTLEIKSRLDSDASEIIHRFIDQSIQEAAVTFSEMEMKKREAQQFENESLQKELYDFFMQAPLALFITDGPNHRFALVNPAHDQLVGKRVVGQTLIETCSAEDYKKFMPILDSVYQTGESWTGEEILWNSSHPSRASKEHYLNVTYHPFQDALGNTKGVMAFILEVTERVNTRKNLKESEERFIQLCESLTDQVVHVMELSPFRISYVSPAYEKIWQQSIASLYQKSHAFIDQVHPEDRESIFAAMMLQSAGLPSELEYRLLRVDGSIRWIKDRTTPLLDDQGIAYRAIGIAEDITERKVFEQKLQESEAKFRTIADAMPQMVWSTLPNGFHDYYNKRWYEFTGVPEGSTDGEAWTDLFYPEDKAQALKIWRDCLANGIPYQTEYRLRHRSGNYRWTLGRALPVRNEKGEIIRWMGTCTDIQDIRETSEALSAALKARDEFISIASHELKTPLTSLKLQTQFMKRGIDKGDASFYSPEKVIKMIEQTEKQVLRLTRLIDDMLDISRIRSGNLTIEKEYFDLGELVKETTERLKSHFTVAGCGFPFVVVPEPCFGDWDRLRMEQVVINLLTNSIRYGSGKPIVIKVQGGSTSVRISVEDHGIGIALENQEKIFNRFERAITANEVSGLGLGLYITKQIVAMHGGRIWVESKLHSGSIFTVELPRVLKVH